MHCIHGAWRSCRHARFDPEYGPKRLPNLSETIDPKSLFDLVKDKNRAEFLAACKPRSNDTLIDTVMKIEYAHWRFRDACLNGRKPPKTVDGDVVQMRHHALNWLLSDSAWDNVTTDT